MDGSNATFSVTYRIRANSEQDARKQFDAVALEQSAEMPPDAIPGHLKKFTGNADAVRQLADSLFEADIQFPETIVDGDPVQFLNVLFGNCSLLPGVQISAVDAGYLAQLLPGPRLGIKGIRNLLNQPDRALSCTALKPVGMNSKELGTIAERFSAGGIDIIKDDHGLANQQTAPFEDRVRAVTEGIKISEDRTGKKTLYFPNITGSPREVTERYRLAAELGADGVLISPQLAGLSTLIDLRNMEPVLPIMAHPAFSGSFVIGELNGILPELYYGLIWRAFGADAVVYPNTGGRFAFSPETCEKINQNCRKKAASFRRSFPVPGGGINRNSIAGWVQKYGSDTIFLVGGSLYQHPGGIETAAAEFQQTLENYE